MDGCDGDNEVCVPILTFFGEEHVCQACNTVSNDAVCCGLGDQSPPETPGYCTDFLDCNAATGFCATPAPEPCPLTASSTQFSANDTQKVFLVDMQGDQGLYNTSVSFGGNGSVLLQHNGATVWNITSEVPLVPPGSIGIDGRPLNNSNLMNVTIDINSGASWNVSISCPYNVPAPAPAGGPANAPLQFVIAP